MREVAATLPEEPGEVEQLEEIEALAEGDVEGEDAGREDISEEATDADK